LVRRTLTELDRRELVQRWSPGDDPSEVRVGLTHSGVELLADASMVVEAGEETVRRTLGVERRLALEALLVVLDEALVTEQHRPELADDRAPPLGATGSMVARRSLERRGPRRMTPATSSAHPSHRREPGAASLSRGVSTWRRKPPTR
jgi:hypothetical protein